ncbi:MAG: DnaB-like helicase C-terminal domain-containing protein [Candidatus Methanomethylophilus sp.]|jgi:hypothetical protein|nr:DnaB-like helicase C-terminal domain-containing protein [Methanomethylophilus sp.]MCI2092537.1 DnaB-like helicase C-terminal domain-containing protein [Methanomethylophilus sp.]
MSDRQDFREYMSGLLQPGETIVMAGRRGHGKTATAVSLCQHAMEGDYGERPILLITNVVFGRKTTGAAPVEDYPPGVYHEDTLSGTMRRIGRIAEEYGRGGATVIWLLDEAQNYMMADQNGAKENLALTKYLGNARKFGVCNFFLTPTVNNLTPRVRCFPTGESKSGYCSCQMIKDKAEASRVIGSRGDPRSITFVRTSPDTPWVPVFIEPTPWIRDIYSSEAKPGDYGYDTVSTATFSVGENARGVPFSFEKFIKATSGGLSHQLAEKIEGFFADWEAEGEEGSAAPSGAYAYTKEDMDYQRAQAVFRRRAHGDPWSAIAEEWDMPKSTLQYQFEKWFPEKPRTAGRTGSGAGYIQPNGEGEAARPPSPEGEA